MEKKLLVRIGGAVLIMAMVSGFGIQHYTTAGPHTKSDQAAIQRQLENAIKESVQLIPTRAVPLSQDTALSSATVARMTATHNGLLRQLFVTQSQAVKRQKRAYNNGLLNVASMRNIAMTFAQFRYTSMWFFNNATTAHVSFKVNSSTTRESRPRVSLPWQTVHLPGIWSGSATLQYHHGRWLISALELSSNENG